LQVQSSIFCPKSALNDNSHNSTFNRVKSPTLSGVESLQKWQAQSCPSRYEVQLQATKQKQKNFNCHQKVVMVKKHWGFQ